MLRFFFVVVFLVIFSIFSLDNGDKQQKLLRHSQLCRSRAQATLLNVTCHKNVGVHCDFICSYFCFGVRNVPYEYYIPHSTQNKNPS